MIQFNIEGISFTLKDRTRLKQWLTAVATEEEKRVGELSYIFCSDDYLLTINKQYLNHSYYTDVITFDYTEGTKVGGDVFISVDTVRANAEEYKQTFLDELHRVMVHGLLHLCGYSDASKEEKDEMRSKEDHYLSKR